MRLIDADKLTEAIKNELWDWETVDGITATTVLKQTITDISNQPTIDAEPIRHGHWVDIGVYPYDEWECDQCGIVTDCYTNYCPNCGAKMDEVKE